MTYSYDSAGDLMTIDYSDTTPDVGYVHDRRGRQVTITQGSTTTTRAYDDFGNLLSESHTGGLLGGISITNVYDQFLRRTNLGVFNTTNLVRQSFAYDSSSRLKIVTDGTNSATYGYVVNSPLVNQVVFTNNGIQRMVTTKQWDLLNRLTNITTVNAAQSNLASFAYQLNSADQRTRRNEPNSYWVYTFDSLGQVTSGKKYWSDGTAVAGQQFDYSFDDTANRKTSAFGGDQFGGYLRTASYSANNVNQYISRTVPGYLDITGSANSNSTVSLWGDDGSYVATYRRGEYFRGELALNNSTGAIWLTITNLAVMNGGTNSDVMTNKIGATFVTKTPEMFAYDADGNVRTDGRWTNTWDSENRLIEMQSRTDTPTPSRLRMEFGYDHLGRRIKKVVSTWNGSTYVAQFTNVFVYDGWNLLAELRSHQGMLRTYMWGLDQGGGGVGSLLAVNDVGSGGAHFVGFDGNGNVSFLVTAESGTVSAVYEYETFGGILKTTGPMSKANPFRFSTKYQDEESGLMVYPFRLYDSSQSRWLSRDPAEEPGGANLYAFVLNNPVDGVDPLGLWRLYDELRRVHPLDETIFFTKYGPVLIGKMSGLTRQIAEDFGAALSFAKLRKRSYNFSSTGQRQKDQCCMGLILEGSTDLDPVAEVLKASVDTILKRFSRVPAKYVPEFEVSFGSDFIQLEDCQHFTTEKQVERKGSLTLTAWVGYKIGNSFGNAKAGVTSEITAHHPWVEQIGDAVRGGVKFDWSLKVGGGLAGGSHEQGFGVGPGGSLRFQFYPEFQYLED